MPGRAMKQALLVAAMLFAAGPVGAQDAQPDPAVLSALGRAQEAAVKEDCPGVLGALDPVLPGIAPGPQRAMIQRMRMVCLGEVGRTADLPAVHRELLAAMPRDPLVKAFGVLIAADENRFSDAADQIAKIADNSPAALDVLTGASVRAISMKLSEDHANDARNRMMIALARADWEPNDFPELRIGFAEGAIDALVDQGEMAEAEGLLERIDQPETLAGMAVDRHYVKLWPAIETRLGPASTVSVDRFALDRLTAYGDMPASEAARRDAVNAMLLLGRYQDVLDMSDDIRVADGMSRDAVRTLLYRARALASLRRNDDVVNLLSGFTKIDIRRAPSASTALVSYAEFLDEIGRSEQALTVARDARTKTGNLLTNLGKRWLDRTEVCALSAMGRAPEANRAMDALKGNADQNQPAAIEALLCAGRSAEASQLALKAFKDTETGAELLVQFQPAASHWSPAPSRLRDLWIAFLGRPEIKTAFERKGRILPRSLWPEAGPRAIPRRPVSGSNLT